MNHIQTQALVVFTLAAGVLGGCRLLPSTTRDRLSQVYTEGLDPSFRAPVKLSEVEALADGLTVEQLYQTSGGKISAAVYMKMAAEGSLWELVRKERQKQLELYLKQNSRGYEAFVRGPVAFNGTPAILFVLLQRVMPELFGNEAFEAHVGLKFMKTTDQLPLGMAWTQPPLAPPADKAPWAVTFTCAACHVQEGRSQDGQVTELVGAPHRRFDINRYRQILNQAVQAPSYNFRTFRAALEKIPPGDLFGPESAAQGQWEKTTFLAHSGEIGLGMMEEFKRGILDRARVTNQTLGQYSYHGDLSLLESSPGKVEAFGFATLALLPAGSLEENPQQTLERYLPKNPSVTDMMAVWQQNKRKLSQWDGSLKIKLLRNLGAELGVAGDPMAVNLANGQTTTGFLGDLPAPSYPYKIDLIRAARGKRVYQTTCSGCHDHERFLELEIIGTDPGRASGLTPEARELLIGGLRAACQGADPAICGAPDSDVLLPRQTKPGYQALPLSGIWSRGPYLHNGSIPTVKQLLVPASRAPVFRLGSLDFDQTQLGFKWDVEPARGVKVPGSRLQVDTSRLGLSNLGHSDPEVFFGGMDFGQEPEVLADLLEYLKSL